MFLLIVHSFALFSQESSNVVDTVLIRQDSLLTDTVTLKLRGISPDAVDKKITYSATEKVTRNVRSKKVFLIKDAVVNYGEIEIRADSIVFDMNTNILFASGMKDSSGTMAGKPVFKEGSQEFEADELTYNFKTRKALVKNILTKQADGLLRSNYTKLMEDGTSNIAKSTYSTCDADPPHFYVNLPKAKVYPGEKIISGPGNLVLEGIPLPLVIPFGFFPIQTKRAESGILIPRIGESRELGYSLTEGGYYFAVSDYFDLTMRGSFYSNGTWLASAQSNYNKRYRYNGNFAFSYADNKRGHKGLEDYSESKNYKISWIYSQDAKASPGSRLSASVNMSSSGFDRNNSYQVAEHVTTQRQSSINYSKSWEGTPYNLSASMSHSQNVKNKTVSLNLPKVSFSAGRIYPLKSKKSTGPTKWYQELQFQYSASLDNQINTYDSILFKKEVWNNMRNGFKHDAPLSFQIRPFRNFSISPSLTYTGVLYTQKIERSWNPDYYNQNIGTVVPSVVTDTLRGMFYGQAVNPSIGASFNPQIFGTYIFTNPDARLKAIRHVVKPSVGFSYIPSFAGLSSKMYRQVQVDTLGTMREYSIYEGNIFGTPSLSRRSGSFSFSLTNIVEGKIFARNDTTGKAKKIKIIDNFGINTSYNIFADSLRWAPVSMTLRTTLFEKISISANSNFSLYGLDSKGRAIGEFYYAQSKKLMRLTNFSTSLDFSLSELLKGSGRSAADVPSQSIQSRGAVENDGMSKPSTPLNPGGSSDMFDEFGYAKFNVPWSLNISYSFSYSKYAFRTNVSQSLSLNGNVSLTKKTQITYTSGYDFAGKKITMTNIGIVRDLHCWEMNFNWVPNGYMKSWNFTIRVKASVLADLKYERRKDFRDNY